MATATAPVTQVYNYGGGVGVGVGGGVGTVAVATDDTISHEAFVAGRVGFQSGNHYGEIDVPECLVPSIGYVIRREGFYFKAITTASGVMTVFFNPDSKKVEITSGNTRFVRGTDGAVAFEHPDDLVSGNPDWDDVSDEGEFIGGSALIADAKGRLAERFARCIRELGLECGPVEMP